MKKNYEDKSPYKPVKCPTSDINSRELPDVPARIDLNIPVS